MTDTTELSQHLRNRAENNPAPVMSVTNEEMLLLLDELDKRGALKNATSAIWATIRNAPLARDAMTDITELTLQNWQTTADLLRHLAGNEIDSDAFAVTHENENGKETECELSITDFALRAAADIDAMLDALAQRDAQMIEMNNRMRQQNRHVCELFDEAKSLREQNSELRAQLAELAAPVAPAGWKLVPVEPTEEMLIAYYDKSIAPIGRLSLIGYRAMLAAAPDITDSETK